MFMTENTASTNQATDTAAQTVPLSESVRIALRNYFNNLDGQDPKDLYKLVLEEVQAPLLQEIMMRTRFNQSRAARCMGISRGTLRKLLKTHGLLDDNVKS